MGLAQHSGLFNSDPQPFLGPFIFNFWQILTFQPFYLLGLGLFKSIYFLFLTILCYFYFIILNIGTQLSDSFEQVHSFHRILINTKCSNKKGEKTYEYIQTTSRINSLQYSSGNR